MISTTGATFLLESTTYVPLDLPWFTPGWLTTANNQCFRVQMCDVPTCGECSNVVDKFVHIRRGSIYRRDLSRIYPGDHAATSVKLHDIVIEPSSSTQQLVIHPCNRDGHLDMSALEVAFAAVGIILVVAFFSSVPSYLKICFSLLPRECWFVY